MSTCEHCMRQQQADMLRSVVQLLEDTSFKLDLKLIEYRDEPDRVAEISRQVQGLVDEAQQRMDNFRETARNHFTADKAGGQQLCAMCGLHWAPAGETHCTRCVKAKDYVPRVYTDEEREVYLREIEAITQGRHQLIPSKEEP